MTPQQECDACLDVAHDTLIARSPHLPALVTLDAAYEARSEGDYPCSAHA